jgi:hypothetical protein
MIARITVVACLAVAQAMLGADQRSDLKLTAARRLEGRPAWFIISAPAHKRVLVSIHDGKLSSLDVSAEFPYSVTLTESPTSRYTVVLLFEDRRKDVVIDSFGMTTRGDLEPTDADTHQKLVDRVAEGRAIGEKLSKEIWREHQ